MKVIIAIQGGCAEVIEKPLGVNLIIRDYDVLHESCGFDAGGRPCTETHMPEDKEVVTLA